MKEFNMGETLDVFYVSRLSHHVRLWEVVKLVVISSQTNAIVRKGVAAPPFLRHLPLDPACPPF